MPELTHHHIAHLRALEAQCVTLGVELAIIEAIAYPMHFPEQSGHTGGIDFVLTLDLEELADLERRLLADGCVPR